MSLLDPRSIREIAARLDLRPTKQRGQNFVVDANTVRRIVAASGVGADDVVLEVGPGLGSLTLGLLEVADRVVAVEIDELLAGELPRTVAERLPERADRLDVVTADAMRVTELPATPTAVVANLPYNVAVPVLLHLLATFPEWQRGLVMVQAEVADRIAAPPGSKVYGVPSVKTAWYAESWRAGSVSPSVFWPVPNVDSGLVALRRREPPATGATRERVFAVVDAAFGQRRKMLRSSLSGMAGSSAAASEALVAAGVDPRHAARCSTWPPSPGSPNGSPDRLRRVPGMASPLPPAPVGVHVRAPAKINLALKVGAPRPDGYHPLATVYHAVSLYDDVHAEWAEPDEFELEASGEGVEQVPLDDSNLALRAARLLARTHGGGDRLGVHLTIRKNIPVAGGLAGGSADGAAALLACATLWDIDLAPEVLRHLGAELAATSPSR